MGILVTKFVAFQISYRDVVNCRFDSSKRERKREKEREREREREGEEKERTPLNDRTEWVHNGGCFQSACSLYERNRFRERNRANAECHWSNTRDSFRTWNDRTARISLRWKNLSIYARAVFSIPKSEFSYEIVIRSCLPFHNVQ